MLINLVVFHAWHGRTASLETVGRVLSGLRVNFQHTFNRYVYVMFGLSCGAELGPIVSDWSCGIATVRVSST